MGGLIPGAVTGEALRTLFNSALAVQFSGFLMPGMDPVVSCLQAPCVHPAAHSSLHCCVRICWWHGM